VSALLEVDDLHVRLPTRSGPALVVNGISYAVEPGSVFGVAGESGSGKTMSVLALLGLLPTGALVEGTATYAGRELLSMSKRSLRDIRGREIAMVFQDPMTALHPMMTIGRQLSEHVRHHLGYSRRQALAHAAALLADVRIPDPERALDAYPHHFSGGMRQRIAIAAALACNPKLLVADEPTTALDVTVQAGILHLLDELRRTKNLAVILITHDLGVMSAIADEVLVMYAGRVVEHGPRNDVLRRPRHPYTKALIGALPHPEASRATPLVAIPGSPPAVGAYPAGCAFHPRCAYAVASCTTDVPPLLVDRGRSFACPVDPFAGED
jgi:oligopeptide/dipeptide ABC transporter ATP-binding protein